MHNKVKEVLTVRYAHSDGCVAAKIKEYPGCMTEVDDLADLEWNLYDALSSHTGRTIPEGSITWIWQEVSEDD
ncbi:hypothetical protein Dthio_PD0386 [Desulfonatronospira thiodismutans ASO3-1]|uniref:Uncharacterized protein n=1 Tax=Desulfonatronospira thiodismutans ASO3-1 TaxID=555779 RepID=D6SUU2_9BACT|nr:hypothetical protein [Desulfonatronospira thiodismutans]EFI33072.1 hypothetical protein Dthio_PD0386 [Desulfonatronospira thiodismutans ASO3-1]